MKYFAKYLPVSNDSDSDRWEWYNNVKNTGWEPITPSDMDAIIAHGLEPQPKFRKVKLFLCSRNIQVGDKVLDEEFEEWTVAKSYEKPNYFRFEHKTENPCYSDSFPNPIKVIGEISSQATWVKEGDEFEEDQIHVMAEDNFGLSFEVSLVRKENIIRVWSEIKGPCGHFH